MNRGQVDYSVRKALEVFDEWNNCTGIFIVGTGYYGEITSIIEDAVHIGIQMALNGKINYNNDGSVKYGDSDD